MVALLKFHLDTEPPAPPPVIDDVLELTLTPQGVICDCVVPYGSWLGYRRSEIVWRHISALLPDLAEIEIMCGEELNPRLRFLSHIGHLFRLVDSDGKPCRGELFIRDTENRGHELRAMIFPADAKQRGIIAGSRQCIP